MDAIVQLDCEIDVMRRAAYSPGAEERSGSHA